MRRAVRRWSSARRTDRDGSPSTVAWSPLRMPAVLVLVALVVTNSAACNSSNDLYGLSSYDRLRGLATRDSSGGDDGDAGRRAFVNFCRERSAETRDSAEYHHTTDIAMLVMAIALEGLGLGINSIAAALPDNMATDLSDERTALLVTGSGAIAAGALFFGLRAALPYDSMQRAERGAAIDFARGADLMEESDPDAVETGIESCIAAERSVATSYSVADRAAAGLAENRGRLRRDVVRSLMREVPDEDRVRLLREVLRLAPADPTVAPVQPPAP